LRAVPAVVHDGRLWRAMENARGPGGGARHSARSLIPRRRTPICSLPRTGTCSNALGSDTNWLDGKFGGWLEGNAVITPEGSAVDLLRCEVHTPRERAAMIHVSDDGKTSLVRPGH